MTKCSVDGWMVESKQRGRLGKLASRGGGGVQSYTLNPEVLIATFPKCTSLLAK